MAKKAKRMRAYRLPEKTISEIERLSREWDCTHGEVIERAIREVDKPPTQNGKVSELKVEYDVE